MRTTLIPMLTMLILFSPLFAAGSKAFLNIPYAETKNEKQTLDLFASTNAKSIPSFLILHIAGHPETGGQSQRLVKKLQAAGISASAYPFEGKTHGCINADLGKIDDKPTSELYSFLEKVLKK